VLLRLRLSWQKYPGELKHKTNKKLDSKFQRAQT
ncbi:uncharacterized protein METZ01_LOCUS231794, partial [marine metagenome]